MKNDQEENMNLFSALYKSLYSKSFYNDVYKQWKVGKAFVYLLLLALIILFMALLMLNKNIAYKTENNIFRLNYNHPITRVLEAIPPVLEVNKQTGYMFYDSNQKPISFPMSTGYISVNFAMDSLKDPRIEMGASRVFITKKNIYVSGNNGISVITPQNIFDRLTKEKLRLPALDTINSIKVEINRNTEQRFDNLSLYMDNKFFKKITFQDLQKFFTKFLRLVFFALLPFVFVLIYIAELLMTMILAMLYFVFIKIIKKPMSFSKIFLLSAFVQSWGAVCAILNFITGAAFFAGITFPVILIFGGFVIAKFVDVDKEVAGEK
jgi:hypothetical protein